MKMTVSLLQSYKWYRDCPASWKERALEALKDTLKGGFQGNSATRRGEEYERNVNRCLRNEMPFHGVQKPLNHLREFEQQRWLNAYTVRVPQGDFTFRGRMDYYGEMQKAPLISSWKGQKCIVDLKTTAGVIKPERYRDSLQHLVYCLSMRCHRFLYVIVRFATDKETDLTPVELDMVPCMVEDWAESAASVSSLLTEMIGFFHDFNLWSDYFNDFNGGNV